VATSPSRAPEPPPSRLRRAAGLLGRLRPRTRLAVVACALWLIGACHLAVTPIGPLARFDLALADMRLALALPPVARPRDDIVIVDIDDASLRELGRWPWPRDRLARLVGTLFDDDHAAALGIDLLFAESDDQGRAVGEALRELDRLGAGDPSLRAGVARWHDALVRRADHDADFARALSGRPVTLAYHFNHVPPPRPHRATMQAAAAAASAHYLYLADLPEPLTEPGVLPASALAMTPWQGIEVPVPALLHASAGAGFINSLPDADGELRSTPLVTAYGGAVYESFGLSLWRQWHRVSVARPVVARGAAGARSREHGGRKQLRPGRRRGNGWRFPRHRGARRGRAGDDPALGAGRQAGAGEPVGAVVRAVRARAAGAGAPGASGAGLWRGGGGGGGGRSARDRGNVRALARPDVPTAGRRSFRAGGRARAQAHPGAHGPRSRGPDRLQRRVPGRTGDGRAGQRHPPVDGRPALRALRKEATGRAPFPLTLEGGSGRAVPPCGQVRAGRTGICFQIDTSISIPNFGAPSGARLSTGGAASPRRRRAEIRGVP